MGVINHYSFHGHYLRRTEREACRYYTSINKTEILVFGFK
jgi:hypothetical protein